MACDAAQGQVSMSRNTHLVVAGQVAVDEEEGKAGQQQQGLGPEENRQNAQGREDVGQQDVQDEGQ